PPVPARMAAPLKSDRRRYCPYPVQSRTGAFLVSPRNWRKIQNTTFFRMRSFLTYLSERCKWASKGTGAVCGWLSLIVGATLAVLLWFYPRWFHAHISDRMTACVLVWYRYWLERAYFSFGGSFLPIQFICRSEG